MNIPQHDPPWPHGKAAAVCLAYDDAMRCHADLVAPALEEHGLRATFYAPIWGDLIANTEAWREMARRGHELGNHTIFHPCRRELAPGSGCLENWNNLFHFTPERFRNELEVANFALHLIDGQTERTYGNTCHEVWIGPEESKQRIEPILSPLFLAGRGGWSNHPVAPATADLLKIGTLGGDGRKFEEWRAAIEEAVSMNGLLILTFHGVGRGSERLQVDESEHLRLLGYLQEHRDNIWSAPLVQIARHLRAERKSSWPE